MKRAIGLCVFFISFLMSGCKKANPTDSANDFQFVTTPAGDSYIFHPKTGEISRVTPEGLDTLDETFKILRVGTYYELEDGGDMRYVKCLGDKKFEPSKFAVRGKRKK